MSPTNKIINWLSIVTSLVHATVPHERKAQDLQLVSGTFKDKMLSKEYEK